MANTNTKRIVRDGFRNAVVELIGQLDTAAVNFSVAPVIQLSDFSTNDPNCAALTGFRIYKIKYSIDDGLKVFLFWNATADQPIAALSGREVLDARPDAGLTPNSGAAGYDGNIDLTVNNVTAAGGVIQSYTLLIEMVKLYRV